MPEKNFNGAKVFIIFVITITAFFIFASNLFADKMFLKQKEEGNEVEVLEEGEDAFIVKIPKDEIEKIQGEDYSQVKLWKERKILWEDQGDYITIFLPKEKIAMPEGKDAEAGTYYGKGRAESFAGALSATGAETTYGPAYNISEGKGRVVGRVWEGERPARYCKVKIVYIKGQPNIFSKLFSGKSTPASSGEEDMIFEAETDENGTYEFNAVPLGDYDLYWMPLYSDTWYRKLSEKPSITVIAGKTVQYEDINLK